MNFVGVGKISTSLSIKWAEPSAFVKVNLQKHDNITYKPVYIQTLSTQKWRIFFSLPRFVSLDMPAQKHCVLCSCCRNNTILHGFDKVSQSIILFNVCYTAFQFNLARGQKVGRLKINLQNLFSWVFVTKSACFGFLSFSIWPWHSAILRQILRSSGPIGKVLNFCGPIILYLFLETFYHFRWYFYSWLDIKNFKYNNRC